MGVDSMQDLADQLQADFDARGGGVAVDFGNWRAEVHAGADRIVVGLGAFDPDSKAFPLGQSPGPVISGNTAAPSVAVRAQEGVAWVHGVAPPDTAEALIPRVSHARTAELLDKTISALFRIVNRAFLTFGGGEWPSASQGDVTYGGLARFRFRIAIPVKGDAYAVVPKPYQVTTTTVVETPDGEIVGAVGKTPPDP